MQMELHPCRRFDSGPPDSPGGSSVVEHLVSTKAGRTRAAARAFTAAIDTTRTPPRKPTHICTGAEEAAGVAPRPVTVTTLPELVRVYFHRPPSGGRFSFAASAAKSRRKTREPARRPRLTSCERPGRPHPTRMAYKHFPHKREWSPVRLRSGPRERVGSSAVEHSCTQADPTRAAARAFTAIIETTRTRPRPRTCIVRATAS